MGWSVNYHIWKLLLLVVVVVIYLMLTKFILQLHSYATKIQNDSMLIKVNNTPKLFFFKKKKGKKEFKLKTISHKILENKKIKQIHFVVTRTQHHLGRLYKVCKGSLVVSIF